MGNRGGGEVMRPNRARRLNPLLALVALGWLAAADVAAQVKRGRR